MLTTLTPMRDPACYKKIMMISTWKGIFIKDTWMYHNKLILQICVPN